MIAIQEELAATIKEPLFIYFDKNPHDGLLEIYNVDMEQFTISLMGDSSGIIMDLAWDKRHLRVPIQIQWSD